MGVWKTVYNSVLRMLSIKKEVDSMGNDKVTIKYNVNENKVLPSGVAAYTILGEFIRGVCEANGYSMATVNIEYIDYDSRESTHAIAYTSTPLVTGCINEYLRNVHLRAITQNRKYAWESLDFVPFGEGNRDFFGVLVHVKFREFNNMRSDGNDVY